VLNKYTADEYVKLGATRIVLARECNLDDIREIADHVKNRAEIEVFVHGAMCMSYSGRCLLSNYLTPDNAKIRHSNRGECNHPCRWKYALVEEKRAGEYMPIEEDARGTYIMNSRDLCLVEHLDALKSAGVKSFKIEGRVKSEYYVGGVVNTYRRVLDGKLTPKNADLELQKTAHREYTTGFVLGETNRQYYKHNAPVQSHEFTAIVQRGSNNDGICTVEMRNAFNVGDKLEILTPNENFNKTFEITEITTANGDKTTRANRPLETLKIACPYHLNRGDILRKATV
jgi:putative protease